MVEQQHVLYSVTEASVVAALAAGLFAIVWFGIPLARKAGSDGD